MTFISLDGNLHCIRSFHSGLTKFTANIMNPNKIQGSTNPILVKSEAKYNAQVNGKYHLPLGRLSYCVTFTHGSFKVDWLLGCKSRLLAN